MNCLDQYRSELLSGTNRELRIIVGTPDESSIHRFRINWGRYTFLSRVLLDSLQTAIRAQFLRHQVNESPNFRRRMSPLPMYDMYWIFRWLEILQNRYKLSVRNLRSDLIGQNPGYAKTLPGSLERSIIGGNDQPRVNAKCPGFLFCFILPADKITGRIGRDCGMPR